MSRKAVVERAFSYGASMIAIVMVFLSAMTAPSPQCQMTLAPSARASMTTSSGAAATPVARRLSSMPRSRNEKLSASTRTPAPASLARSSERAPERAGSTPFWTRNRVTSFFTAASCCARSQQKRTSLESNGSRDSINRYLVIGISLWAGSSPLPLDARPNRAAAQYENRGRARRRSVANGVLRRRKGLDVLPPPGARALRPITSYSVDEGAAVSGRDRGSVICPGQPCRGAASLERQRKADLNPCSFSERKPVSLPEGGL